MANNYAPSVVIDVAHSLVNVSKIVRQSIDDLISNNISPHI